MSKRLLLIFLAFASFTLFAGHEKGGVVIKYTSMAGVNGNPLSYLVEVYAIYETGAIPPPANISISVTSSCFTNYVFNFPRIGNLTPMNSADYCTPGTNIGGSSGLAYYRDTVVLNGVCNDFLFAHVGGFGRYFNTTNVDDNFSGSAYFGITLDNTHGPNSSPHLPITDLIQGLCINTPLTMYSFNEADGDSVYYSASAPQRMISGGISDYPYKSGYSQANQVGSSSGFNVDPNSGVIQTNIGSQGNYIISVRFREYRKDSNGVPVEIADGRYSTLVVGVNTCLTPAPKIKYPSAPGSDSVACGNNTLDIAVNRRLVTATLAPDGSDFLVSDQNGPVMVTGAMALSDTIVRLMLANPVSGGANLTVTTDTGSDGNVLVSVCGNHYQAYDDTLTFYSQGVGNASAAYTYTSNFHTLSFNAGASLADSLHWDFGDGSPGSAAVSPVHTFPFAGIFSVSLTAYSACGATDVFTMSINVCDSLTASFATALSGDTVTFNATSNGAIKIYWDMGDGSSDTGQSVTHVYANAGSYYVLLTVINACGDTLRIGDTVNTCAAPVSSWTYQIISTSGSGMVVDFDGTASLNAVSWYWDFGDGNTSTASLTPRHTYATPGLTYLVSLSVVNACGDSTSYAYKLSEIGLEELKTQVEIFPNPASDEFHINLENTDATYDLIRIYNLDGKMVQEMKLIQRTSIEIPVSDIPEGIYILELNGTGSPIRQLLQIAR